MDLTILSQVLRGLGNIYLLAALAAIAIALYKPGTAKQRAIRTGIVVAVFGIFPLYNWAEKGREQAFSREAWAYFKKLCDEKSGEKIYKTFTDVESVVVIKPLPAATERDLHNQFWYGDPYSNATPWDKRGESVARSLAGNSRRADGSLQKGLAFVEIKNGGTKFKRIFRPLTNDSLSRIEIVDTPSSRFAVSWEDISKSEDRKYWIAASRFKVIDSRDQSIVAERIGYLIEPGFGSIAGQRSPWLSGRTPSTTCPSVLGDYSDQQFITKVFRQGGA